MYAHQDWDPVVIHSKTHHQLERRQRQNAPGTKRAQELNEEGGIPSLKTITKEQSKELESKRNKKGLTRKDLANLIPHLTVKTIEEYENGTTKNFALPTLNKMNRTLDKLPDKLPES